MKNRIRVERAEVRMTQQQLADAIGVSRQTVNAIEAGRFVPSTVLALKIARIFGKPVEQVSSSKRGTDPAEAYRGRQNARGTVPRYRPPYVSRRARRPAYAARTGGVTQQRKPYNLMS